ncbi:LysR family transcriptional regulator [Qingshengfaniella alkalisoli]|uniref:LysR family transcriptional regulator n=1 Tax=Qingshengfaniella alkalisoli TaxID=2599296 RepID=A0A5B8J2D1_9RHOB|nr:LysR family transcriptional regulator [Qingshengfaniella alkalisoli]QDY70938.1 LysR family transcriptional regulator [Qingshengfaniella alkalisoli]
MNWDDARLFLAVARSGQMLSAARSLGINQATLSRRMRVLEDSLQVRLLDRHPQGCHLTDEGRALMARLERAETEFLQAEGEIGGTARDVAGTVRIGAPDGFGTAFLAPRLPQFIQQYPQMSVQLVPVPRSFSLSQREADIAVMVGRPEQGQLIGRKLTDYSLSLYAADSYLANAPALAAPDDLRDHMLVGYVHDLIYASALGFTERFWRGWRSRIEVASALGQQEVVRAGGGVGVLHDYLVTPQMGLRRVLPELTVTLSYWLVYHPSLRGVRRVQVMADFLKDICHNIHVTSN